MGNYREIEIKNNILLSYFKLTQRFIYLFSVIGTLLISSIPITGFFSITTGAEIPLTIEEQAWLSAHPKITIAYLGDYGPYSFRNQQGVFKGISVDLVSEVARRVGLRLKTYPDGNWEHLYLAAQRREVDVIGGILKRPSRSEWFDFTKPYLSTAQYIITRKKEREIQHRNDISGKTVALVKGYATTQTLLNDFPTVKPYYVENVEDAFEAVSLGKADASLGVMGAVQYFIAENGIQNLDFAALYSNDITKWRISVRKDWPLLRSILDKSLASITDDERQQIFLRWTTIDIANAEAVRSINENLKLTDQEKAWLDKDHKVQVRITNFPPYIILKKDVQPEGLTIDYLNLISERTGIKFDYIHSGKSFPEALEGLKRGEGPDLISTIMRTPEREKVIFFSEDYYSSPYVIFTHEDFNQFISNPTDLSGLKIALPKGTVIYKKVMNAHPDLNLLLFESDAKAIEAVATHKADLYIGNMTLASFLILQKGLSNLKVAGPSFFGDHVLSMGIRADWPELVGITNKALASISFDEQTKIRNKYISIAYEHAENGLIIKGLLIFCGMASGILFLFIFWNRSLKSQIAKRTSELNSSKKQYKKLYGNALIGMARTNIEDGKPIYANELVAELFGYSTVNDFIHGFRANNHYANNDDRDVLLNQIKEKGFIDSVLMHSKKLDGTLFWNEATFKLNSEEGFIDWISIDVSERIKTEQKLRYQNTLLENVSDAIVSINKNFEIISWNTASEKIYGWAFDEVQGKRVSDVLKIDYLNNQREAVTTAINKNGVWLGETKQTRKNGEQIYVQATISLIKDKNDRSIGYVSVNRDITNRKKTEEERKKLELQLGQSQKMESIGTLAGGIAHDFNNILSGVLGFTELALGAVEKETPIEMDLQQVYTAGLRAKDLVQQILTFARQSEEEIKPIQVDLIIKEVLKFIRSSIPTTIEIKHNIKSNSLIMGSSTQIHRLMMNLCTNAAHEMEKKGGVLEITLKDITIDNISPTRGWSFKPGNYIEIKVSDTGDGIDPQIIDKIFEPYFTTKKEGEGTGMGLAMVHGIVETYGGKIFVKGRLSKGTIFTIYLPIAGEGKAHHQFNVQELSKGQERILFVDDEVQLAELGSRILGQLGYTVTIKTNSLEALELFESTPNAFDLVISDVTMPKMTGDQLTKKLIEIRSDIPIILCTGYSKKLSAKRLSEIGVKAIVYKPIVQENLAKKVREVLDVGKD